MFQIQTDATQITKKQALHPTAGGVDSNDFNEA